MADPTDNRELVLAPPLFASAWQMPPYDRSQVYLAAVAAGLSLDVTKPLSPFYATAAAPLPFDSAVVATKEQTINFTPQSNLLIFNAMATMRGQVWVNPNLSDGPGVQLQNPLDYVDCKIMFADTQNVVKDWTPISSVFGTGQNPAAYGIWPTVLIARNSMLITVRFADELRAVSNLTITLQARAFYVTSR